MIPQEPPLQGTSLAALKDAKVRPIRNFWRAHYAVLLHLVEVELEASGCNYPNDLIAFSVEMLLQAKEPAYFPPIAGPLQLAC